MTLSADCLAHLQLTQEPFAAAADEAFLYTDTLLESMQALALTALEPSNAIVFFAGGSGSGRSVQLMQLLSNLPAALSLIAFRGRRHTTFAAVDLTIRNHLRSLGMDVADQPLPTLLAALSQQPVIAIDDAHLLGNDIVRQLLNLRTEVITTTAQQLRLVLVGTVAAAQQYIHALDADDAPCFKRINMRPLSLEQVQGYLAHRLRVAGCATPEEWLTAPDVTQLYQRSEGLPLALNMLATEWLTRRCRALEREAQKPLLPEPTVADTVVAAPVTRPVKLPVVAPVRLAWWRRRWVMPSIAGLGMLGVVFLLVDNMPSSTTHPFTLTTPKMPPVTVATVVAPSNQPTPPPADVAPVVTPPPVTTNTTQGRVADPDAAWLAQQDADAFAVLLLTAMSRQTLLDYIAQHQLQDVRIIATRNKRFIAVLGSFPDRTSAATAAAQLPLAVLSQGHWVRRIADIQAEVRP